MEIRKMILAVKLVSFYFTEQTIKIKNINIKEEFKYVSG